MEELFGRGSHRPLRGADEREKVVAAKIVGRTKKRENRYKKRKIFVFLEKIFFLKRYFFWR